MSLPQTQEDAKGVVQLVAASANANFADKIARALLRAGYALDPGEFDPKRIDAVVVLWTGVALDKPALIDVARDAWKAHRLAPVSIGRIEPPFASKEMAPMDLAGWRGDDEDPRWRFVLSDIEALIARAQLDAEADEQQLKMPFLLDDLQGDEAVTPHHPARAMWRNRVRPAAPMVAGLAGALTLAAGAAFMAGSLQSRPAPIQTIAASGDEAQREVEEAAAEPGRLAFVHPAPGVRLPEEETAPVAESESPVSTAPDDFAFEMESVTDLAEPALEERNEADVLADGEDPTLLAALFTPRLKPAHENIPDTDEIGAEDLNQTALQELAAAIEGGVETEPPAPMDRDEAYKGDFFSDCTGCPEMAALEGGAFLMGAAPGEQDRLPEEGPQRRVSIGYRFAIATRETTFDQWALCVEEGGCRDYTPDDAGWGRGARPVINVSFEDASAYARWLSAKTGYHYRLPSEAEWEYAARAGGADPFHMGQGISAVEANFNGGYPYRSARGLFRAQTVPVTSFAHNAFGLFDMHGNVWEWTLDCWAASHNGAPVTGAARIDGDCNRRAVKGGAWDSPGWRLRAAHRRGVFGETQTPNTGFRVVRVLD